MSDSLDASRNDSLDEFKESARAIFGEIKDFVLRLAQELKEPFAYEVVAGTCRQFVRDHTGSKDDHFDTFLWPEEFHEVTGEQDCATCLYALEPWPYDREPTGEDFSRSLNNLIDVFDYPFEWISGEAMQALGMLLANVPRFAFDADTSVQKQRLREELLNYCIEVIELAEWETDTILKPARAGKPGRPRETDKIADFANEKRQEDPPMSWINIPAAWEREHGEDERLSGKTETQRMQYVRDCHRRKYGDKRRK